MKGEVSWYLRSCSPALVHTVLAGLRARFVIGAWVAPDCFGGLSGRPGHEGEQVQVSENEIQQELRDAGMTTLQFWHDQSGMADVLVSFYRKDGGCVVNGSFEGHDVPEAGRVVVEMLNLACRPELIEESIGFVVDDALPETHDEWDAVFFGDAAFPRTPQLIWQRSANGQFTLNLAPGTWLPVVLGLRLLPVASTAEKIVVDPHRLPDSASAHGA